MKGKNVLLVLLCGLLFAACTPKKDNGPVSEVAVPAPIVRKEVNELPKVTLIHEDGQRFSATSLPGKTILVFFFAECEHCQREAADFERNLGAFKEYTLYFISMDEFPLIKKFAETYKINNQPNIKFARADGNTVFSAMGNITTPTICVYNGSKQLSRRFDGETNVQEIIKVLKDS